MNTSKENNTSPENTQNALLSFFKTIPGIGILLFLALFVIWSVNFYNSSVALEQQIIAKVKDNEQLLSNMQFQIESASSVASEYSAQVDEAMKIAFSGRYGKDGVQGAMTWLKEQNPEIKPEVYLNIQQIIQINYAKFASSQTTLNELGQLYITKMRDVPANVFAGFYGFSEHKMDKYIVIVTSEEAKSAFKSSTMKAIDPFGKK